MGLKKFEKDMNIIAALDDEPNDVGGLSAAQLKEKFDQAGREIKEYINEDMIPALEAETAAASLGVRMPSSSGREGPGTIQEAIDSLSEVAMGGGAVPSGGLPGQILAKADAEDHHLKWISADAEAFGSYQKEKILSAATKTLFGLEEDAVPDDVLAKIAVDRAHKVGDILKTVRTDLGDKWLLCNGEIFDKESYPELSAIKKLNPLDTFSDLSESLGTSSSDYPHDAIYANGYYVIVFRNSDTSELFVMVSQDLVSWSKKTLADTSLTSITYPYIEYENGEFLVFGPNSSIKAYNFLYHSSDPLGEWNYVEFAHGISTNTLHDVTGMAYGNGYYVMLGYYSNKIYLWFTTTLDGSWSRINLSDQTACTGRLRFIEGTFLFSYPSGDEKTANICSFTNPAGAIASSPICTMETAYSGSNSDIVHVNGEYIIFAFSGSLGKDSLLFHANSIDGNWDCIKFSSRCGVNSRACSIGDKFFVLLDASNSLAALYYGADVGQIEELVITKPTSAASGSAGLAISEDAILCAMHKGGCIANVRTKLPAISVDAAYAYIKAAE
ncbi:MAG: hypothetical protein ACI3V3_04265 [Faecousia sp.]